MQNLEHANVQLLGSYPGSQITEQEKDAFDNFTASMDQFLRPDGSLVIYGLSQSLSALLTYLSAAIEEEVGEETTLKILRGFGRAHGMRNYGRFLKTRGVSGGPRAMCEYQDLSHAARGPRQATALFAQYDDNSVLVERTDCAYFMGKRGEPNKYVRAVEDGMIAGYKEIDGSLVDVINDECLCSGSSNGCRHRFVFSGK